MPPYLQPGAALSTTGGLQQPGPPHRLLSAGLGAAGDPLAPLGAAGCGDMGQGCPLVPRALSEQRGWRGWGRFGEVPALGFWGVCATFWGVLQPPLPQDPWVTARRKESRGQPLVVPKSWWPRAARGQAGATSCQGLAVAAQVTLPQFLSPHGGDSRSGGHLTPQGRVPSSRGCCLSGCPRRRGLIAAPQVASRNASASLPRRHKHPGTALAPWGHMGSGDMRGLGTRTATVLHGEVTQPSWGHVAEGFVPQGTVCDTGTWLSAGHTRLGGGPAPLSPWGCHPRRPQPTPWAPVCNQ